MAHWCCRSSKPLYQQLVGAPPHRVEAAPYHSKSANVKYAAAPLPFTRVARGSDSVNHFSHDAWHPNTSRDVHSSEALRPDSLFLICPASNAANGSISPVDVGISDSGFPFSLVMNNLKTYTGHPHRKRGRPYDIDNRVEKQMRCCSYLFLMELRNKMELQISLYPSAWTVGIIITFPSLKLRSDSYEGELSYNCQRYA